jgi:GNAT superfamily N-acetyltransferase
MQAAEYSAVEALHNGRTLQIRALRPQDHDEVIRAISRTSPQSLFRRFFSAKRHFSDQEIAFFLNIDFVKHVALVALIDEHGRRAIVGGGRYIVVQPGRAELAFAVIDQYQGQGIGASLLRHLVTIARAAGLGYLFAEVLQENIPMLKVFEASGLRLTAKREREVVHITLDLAPA